MFENLVYYLFKCHSGCYVVPCSMRKQTLVSAKAVTQCQVFRNFALIILVIIHVMFSLCKDILIIWLQLELWLSKNLDGTQCDTKFEIHPPKRFPFRTISFDLENTLYSFTWKLTILIVAISRILCCIYHYLSYKWGKLFLKKGVFYFRFQLIIAYIYISIFVLPCSTTTCTLRFVVVSSSLKPMQKFTNYAFKNTK